MKVILKLYCTVMKIVKCACASDPDVTWSFRRHQGAAGSRPTRVPCPGLIASICDQKTVKIKLTYYSATYLLSFISYQYEWFVDFRNDRKTFEVRLRDSQLVLFFINPTLSS